MPRHICLLLPGLLERSRLGFDGEPAADDIEALEWMLTLARHRFESQRDIPSLLWHLAGQSGPVPVAGLSYIYDHRKLPVGPLMRIDPVCLTADQGCVRLQAAELPDLTFAEAGQLIDMINQQFNDQPWRVVAGTAQRWYLLLDEEAGITTRSPEQVLGQNIYEAMPSGDKQAYWRKILNEIQMLMFNSRINEQRQAEGKLAANSVWLWGEGELPVVLSLSWTAVYSNDPVTAGLARLAGLVILPPPASAQQLLQASPPSGVVLCQPVLQPGLEGLVKFNHDWVLPLYKALQRSLIRVELRPQLASVELQTANGSAYRLSAGTRRWWRRRRRIDNFME